MKHVWIALSLVGLPAACSTPEPARGNQRPPASVAPAGPPAGTADAGSAPRAVTRGGTNVSNGELERHLAALSSEHTEDVAPAADWLVAHPEQARPRLVALVRAAADDQATRRAMEILARIGHGDDVAPLADVLALGRGSLSWTAAQALAVHPAVAARDALLAALRARKEEVVSAAVVALGQRRDEAARPALEGLLDHPSAGVRFRVVRALAALGAKASVSALQRRRAVEPDGEVKAAIDATLKGS